jgi:hypothetical protein
MIKGRGTLLRKKNICFVFFFTVKKGLIPYQRKRVSHSCQLLIVKNLKHELNMLILAKADPDFGSEKSKN